MSIHDVIGRHGGPGDRGVMDSYYRRGFNPHYYKGDTYTSERVFLKDMSAQEIKAYTKGYNFNEQQGDFKDWG